MNGIKLWMMHRERHQTLDDTIMYTVNGFRHFNSYGHQEIQLCMFMYIRTFAVVAIMRGVTVACVHVHFIDALAIVFTGITLTLVDVICNQRFVCTMVLHSDCASIYKTLCYLNTSSPCSQRRICIGTIRCNPRMRRERRVSSRTHLGSLRHERWLKILT